MTIFYSAANNGFYESDLHTDIPNDAKEISADRYAQIMHAQTTGYEIKPGGDGLPVLVLTPVMQVEIKSCTPAQGLVALYALRGITEDDVLAAIEQIPDSIQRYTTKIGYQRATVWERNSTTMQALAKLLQLTSESLDELFSHAVTVQV